MSDTKTYMRALVPGFTFATKSGPGDILNEPGSIYPADLVADSVIDDIKRGVERMVQDEDQRRAPAELVDLTDDEALPLLREDLKYSASGFSPDIAQNVAQGLQEPADPDLGGDGAPGTGDPDNPADRGFDPVGQRVADILEYLKSASPEEVERVKAAEAENTKRQGGPSAQVAAFEPSE
jgi:hypothetical protein